MPGLSWIRVDSSLASNHKVLHLLSERGGDHALCVYVFGLGHCGIHGTDGFLPEVALGLIHGRKRDADLLTEVGMWKAIPGGFEVPDWKEYQPSSEESEARSKRAREAAEQRWSKRNGMQ